MEKKSEEILAELYRNSLLAMQSIENILPAAGPALPAKGGLSLSRMFHVRPLKKRPAACFT